MIIMHKNIIYLHIYIYILKIDFFITAKTLKKTDVYKRILKTKKQFQNRLKNIKKIYEMKAKRKKENIV